MSDIPKIDFSELKRTNLGFPSEFKINTTRIHYRYGKITIYVDNIVALETEKYWEDADVGGFLSDEDLYKILKHHDLLIDK